jgi:DNA-binding transcriptional ArsR family regulator
MAKTEDNCIRGCANITLINRGIQGIDTIHQQIESSAKILNLAGNTTRLKILYLIRSEERICVCDMSDILGLSVSAISQQLRKLKEGHLLKSKKEGQTIFYEIHPNFEGIIDHLFALLNKEEIRKIA